MLPDSARRRLAGLDSAARAHLTRFYWAAADPLWSRRGATPRTEFLARVAFAELRWTVDDLRVRGADTDRGDAYIRWGPPHEVMAFGPTPGEVGVRPLVTTFWWYRWGLLLAFEGPPRLAVATTAFGDQAFVEQMRDVAPVRWLNIAHETVAPMPVQVARFRAAADSLDVVIAVAVPVDSIRSLADVSGPVRADFWLLGEENGRSVRDSVAHVPAGAAPTVTFGRRVPRRDYLYRLEATADGSLFAGQVTGLVGVSAKSGDAFPGAGFGMSDVLLASSIVAPPNPARWTDLVLTPIAGGVPRGGSLTLVWENYEFFDRDGMASYSVDVTVAPVRSGVGRVAMRAIGALGRALGVAGDDDAARVVFDRTRAYATVMPDFVTIGLDGTAPGRYKLTLRVTDIVAGATLERIVEFEIR